MLRFGDGSPFPLGEGFLDLLVDAVNGCALMLGAAANLDRRRAAAEAVRRELADEARRLAELEHSVEHATAPCRPANVRLGRTSERAAEQMLRAAREVLESSRAQLERKIARRAINPSWHRTARRVQAAAGRFFDRNSLPGTSWSWWWDASTEIPRAEALAESRRFAAMFDLDLVPLWRRAIRMDSLLPGFALPLPRRRLFRAPVVEVVALARHLLVYAHRDATGRVLELRDPNGATGWRVDLPDQGQASATAVDRRGRELGVGLVADDDIAPLVRTIDDAMIVHLRVRRARSTSLDGTPIAELPDTTAAARALLDEIGPTVRAIRERSRVPGELSLKRDIADRLREEVYISRASLTARYANLPPPYRQLFDAAGFGRNVDSVVGELPSAPAPSSGEPRPTARGSEPASDARQHWLPDAPAAEPALRPSPPRLPVVEIEPAARPSQSMTVPAQPAQPALRPSQPMTVPAQPAVRPSQSMTVPAQPALRPSQPMAAQPAVRPSQSMTVPVQPALRPSQPMAAQPAVRPSQSMTIPAQPALRPSQPMAAQPAVRPSESPTIERSPFAADAAAAEAPTIPNAAALDAAAYARTAPSAVAASAFAPAPASHARSAQMARAANAPAAAPPTQASAPQPAPASRAPAAPSHAAAAVYPIASGTASLIHSAAPSLGAQPSASPPASSAAASGPASAAARGQDANAPRGPLSSLAPARSANGTSPPPRMAAGSVYLSSQPEAPTVPRAPSLPRLPGVAAPSGSPPDNAFDPTTTRDETQPMVPAPNPVRPLPGLPVARIRPITSSSTPTPVTVTGEITVRR